MNRNPTFSRTTRSLIAAACAVLFIAASLRAADLKRQPAEFQTEDGVTIVGDYFPATGRVMAPAAVLLHMYRHDRTTWKPLIGPMHDAGFAVLAIDMRGHGESVKPADMNLAKRVDERDEELFRAMHKDAAAAVEWLRRQPNVDPSKTVLVGASIGCSVSLDHASRDKTIDAVVCLTPGKAYLGVDSVEHIKKIEDAPILLIASADEREDAEALAELNKNAKAEIVAEGRIHGTRMFGEVDGIEEKIVAFLRKALEE